MEYLEVDGRLFELTVLYEAHGDDVVVECYDMRAEDGGEVGTIRVGADGRGRLALQREVPVVVLRRWLQLAETEAGLVGRTE